ncbi:MAG TPA: hypothetical protein VEZ90_06840 [Blastocatellia bacterium]|nr:hypothetical protein [Blastocatellia bacterium]
MWGVLFLALILIILIGVWVSKFSSEAFPGKEPQADGLNKPQENSEINKNKEEREGANAGPHTKPGE